MPEAIVPGGERKLPISEADFALLASWASVSRTLTEAMRLLELLGTNSVIQELTDDAFNCHDEIQALRPVLDRLNAAAKELKHQEQRAKEKG